MSAAVAEPPDAINTIANSIPSNARKEASRANGALSRGPSSPEGKARSRRNGCKDGLTGAGIVLPADAEVEVGRREAEFALDFRPRTAVERELVRQIALASWRRQELAIRIVRHDARVNAARFANWDQDEQIVAAELGRRLADDPEASVARLQRSSTGCAWLIGRWTLLGNGLSSAEEGGPDCTWTDAELTLALNLLGRPADLRRLDDWPGWLESLREQARAGSDEAVTELRRIIADEVADLEERQEEAWKSVEEPMLQDWYSGLDIDLGPEGTRLRRYEAAADRLFRSAWTKLERIRTENREPLVYRHAHVSTTEHVPPPIPAAAPPPEPAPPAPAQVSAEALVQRLQRFGDPAATVLDLWVGGTPRTGHQPRHSCPEQDEPSAEPAHDGRTSRPAQKSPVATPWGRIARPRRRGRSPSPSGIFNKETELIPQPSRDVLPSRSLAIR